MSSVAYLASTFVTGVVLLSVAAFAFYLRRGPVSPARNAYLGPSASSNRSSTGTVERVATRWSQSTTVWILCFVAITLGFVGAAVGYVSGLVSSAVVMQVVVPVSALLLAGYLLYGFVHSARARGMNSAHIAGLAVWAGGLLMVSAITVMLVTA